MQRKLLENIPFQKDEVKTITEQKQKNF
jgi:hypothetical protein